MKCFSWLFCLFSFINITEKGSYGCPQLNFLVWLIETFGLFFYLIFHISTPQDRGLMVANQGMYLISHILISHISYIIFLYLILSYLIFSYVILSSKTRQRSSSVLRYSSSFPPPLELLHAFCSAYIFGNNGWILMFKVSKQPYRSAWHDDIICK